ncbi:MAG: 2,3-diaminopropionate biosynthesis protein SbnA [Verrucomicrobiales bacterium]|nr:2,3-diaminopropionate biosynthesis protein SbnA [Verrucomicrobiales bacterium]
MQTQAAPPPERCKNRADQNFRCDQRSILDHGQFEFSPDRFGGITDHIGGTPVVELKRLFRNNGAQVFAKLEALNPGGSAKDRPARAMIEDAIASGEVTGETTVVESSSGNMGIGLAQICRYYGLPFVCVVDANAQIQNLRIMEALGATIDLVETAEREDPLSARLDRVRALVDSDPRIFWPNQYSNLSNPRSHLEGTVRELDEALQGELDYLFVATSSTGTALGCQEYLRSKGRSTEVVAVDAEGSVLFGGSAGRRRIPGLGAGVISPLARKARFDRVVRVSELDCVVGCRSAAHYEALLIGGSGGGVVEAIRSCGEMLDGSTVGAIFHDSGQRYLETVFSDGWVESNLGLSASEMRSRVMAFASRDTIL